jgi:hydrogenase/urease accessory protein HupE
MLAEIIYILCALASLFCAVLLWRSYRRSRTRLLMWSTLCFVGLAVNNVLLVIDLMLVPDVDVALVRSGVALVSLLLLLIGLTWEEA